MKSLSKPSILLLAENKMNFVVAMHLCDLHAQMNPQKNDKLL
jgi:hypothetical protein